LSAPRKTVFVLVSSDHGTMIVSRLDYAAGANGSTWGVGYRLLENGAWNQREVGQLVHLLGRQRAPTLSPREGRGGKGEQRTLWRGFLRAETFVGVAHSMTHRR
jgi:hypothetical protein